MSSTHDAGHGDRPATRRVLRRVRPLDAAPIPLVRPSTRRLAGGDAGSSPSSPGFPPPRPSAIAPFEAPPPERTTHASVPPVVSSVVTELPPGLDAASRAAASRKWKGGLVGAVLGLALVGAFVIGARLAQSGATPASAVGGPRVGSAGAIVARPVPASPAQPSRLGTAAPPPAPEPPGPPLMAANELPRARPVPASARPAAGPRGGRRRGEQGRLPRGRRRGRVEPQGSASDTEPADPPVADAPASLTPVIPASPPPEVDPLLKAVQQAIDESKSQGQWSVERAAPGGAWAASARVPHDLRQEPTREEIGARW